jgi:hypothetical protein
MSTHSETRPIECIGGPHDGLGVCITSETGEVRRPTSDGRQARYIVVGRRAYFAGYARPLPAD